MTKVCPVCGKEFEPTGNRTKYCCENCRRKGQANKERIIKYNNGTTPIERDIIAAYHGECAICGWRIASGLISDKKGKVRWQYGNELHHIVMASDGGENGVENRILLCPNHHAQANAGLITPEELKRHQKPVPLPKEEVAKDLKAIERAVKEYAESGEHEEMTPESVRFCWAMDLAVMLGRAGLIDSYQDADGQLILIEGVIAKWAKDARERARQDKKSNEYKIRKWNWFQRILNIRPTPD